MTDANNEADDAEQSALDTAADEGDDGRAEPAELDLPEPGRLERHRDILREKREGNAERHRRSDVGASLSVKFKRGEGTRDQDEWRIKGKGETAEEALREFDEQLSEVEAELADRVRNLQPEVSEEDEG